MKTNITEYSKYNIISEKKSIEKYSSYEDYKLKLNNSKLSSYKLKPIDLNLIEASIPSSLDIFNTYFQHLHFKRYRKFNLLFNKNLARKDNSSGNLYKFNHFSKVLNKYNSTKEIFNYLKSINLDNKKIIELNEKINEINKILEDEDSEQINIQSIKSFILFLLNLKELKFKRIIPSPEGNIQFKFENKSDKLILSFLADFEINYAFLRIINNKQYVDSGNSPIKEFIENKVLNNSDFLNLLTK